MVSIFEDPKQLVRSDKVTEFWPTKEHSAGERVNATARFIIYATCILYLIKRDIRIFVLGGTAIGVLYVMERTNMVKKCDPPTVDNPMGNVLMNEYSDRPDRPSACEDRELKNARLVEKIPYGAQRSRSALPEYQRNGFSRQFVTMPVTDIPGDQTAFAEWLYGAKGEPNCRTDPSLCNPNARGVQLEAFSGLDFSGNFR